jgi:hypothetical protein
MTARRHQCLSRTILLVLLMLGVMISPVLAVVGELHGIEHAAMAAGDGAHEHDHDHDHGHRHTAAFDRPHHHGEADPDHVSGAHGLMHQTVNVTVTMPDMSLAVSFQSAREPRLPEFSRIHPPSDFPNLPFRPPIA